MNRALLLLLPLFTACITPKPSTTDDSGDEDDSGNGDDSGGGGGNVTIYDIQKGSVEDGATVTLTDVVVTSGLTAEGDGFFVQEQAGGEYSGMYIFLQGSTSDLTLYVGDTVTLSGEVSEYYDFTEVTVTSTTAITVTGEATATPESLTGTESFTSEDWEPWESVLVSLPNQEVIGDVNSYGEAELSGGLVMDNLFFDFETEYGATYTEIIGPITYSFEEFKINPRDTDDLVGYTPGEGPQVTSICDIQQGQETGDYEGRTVLIEGAIATSGPTTNGGGFWVATPEGGEWCGIYVYVRNKDAAPTVGDTLTFEASVTDYYELTELSIDSYADVTTTASGATPVVTTLETAPESWESYEGVLVTITNVTATEGSDEYGAVALDFGGLKMDDDLYYYDDVSAGESYEALTGLITYSYEEWKIIPRDSADMGGTGGGGGGGTDLGTMSIAALQQAVADGTASDGDTVTLERVIATSELTTTGKSFFVQDVGGGAWSGVYVYVGSTGLTANLGDELTLTGTVSEYYDLTEIEVSAAEDLVSTGVADPTVTTLTEAPADWEPYESVLVAFSDVEITSDEDSYGQYTTSYGAYIDDCFEIPALSNGDVYSSVTGLMYYSYSEWKLCPRGADDFVE